jgi:hypothetical protein
MICHPYLSSFRFLHLVHSLVYIPRKSIHLSLYSSSVSRLFLLPILSAYLWLCPCYVCQVIEKQLTQKRTGAERRGEEGAGAKWWLRVFRGRGEGEGERALCARTHRYIHVSPYMLLVNILVNISLSVSLLKYWNITKWFIIELFLIIEATALGLKSRV